MPLFNFKFLNFLFTFGLLIGHEHIHKSMNRILSFRQKLLSGN